jgi:hypothetical protein
VKQLGKKVYRMASLNRVPNQNSKPSATPQTKKNTDVKPQSTLKANEAKSTATLLKESLEKYPSQLRPVIVKTDEEAQFYRERGIPVEFSED